MTREDIIRMAREAGFDVHGDTVFVFAEAVTVELMRFAELVAAAEREKLNKKIAALEADVDHFFKLSGQYLERANKAEEAVALERQRCAKVRDDYAMPDGTSEVALALAAAIRGTK